MRCRRVHSRQQGGAQVRRRHPLHRIQDGVQGHRLRLTLKTQVEEQDRRWMDSRLDKAKAHHMPMDGARRARRPAHDRTHR